MASQDGYLYVYSIPSIEGGECQLIKKHDLRNSENFSVDVKGKFLDSLLFLRKHKLNYLDSPKDVSSGDAKPATLPSGPSYAETLKGDKSEDTKEKTS